MNKISLIIDDFGYKGQCTRRAKRTRRYISPFINFIYLTFLILSDKLRVRRTPLREGPKGPVNIIDNYYELFIINSFINNLFIINLFINI